MQPSTIHPLQEALEALEDAQQSADAASSIHDCVARQAEVLEQLQSQLEEAQHQQVGFCGIFSQQGNSFATAAGFTLCISSSCSRSWKEAQQQPVRVHDHNVTYSQFLLHEAQYRHEAQDRRPCRELQPVSAGRRLKCCCTQLIGSGLDRNQSVLRHVTVCMAASGGGGGGGGAAL